MSIAVVDLIGALLLLALAASGGVLHWYLPPGSGHAEGGRLPKMLFGMTRHDWGDVHFVLSLVFLAVMAIHLWQHRAWIRGRSSA